MTNMTEPARKYCKDCETIKPVTDCYAAGASIQPRCKPCHNAHRSTYDRKRIKKERAKQPNPFEKLPQEKQDEIMKYLNTMMVTQLGKKVGISHNTLYKWRLAGYLPKKQ